MTAERYEISEGALDVLAITGPEGTRYIDGEEIEARAIRQQARDLDQLRTDRAALVAENAALLAANRDLKAHFDALKGDYDEAAHFARHFIRDDAAITPRGAIIRLGDKCTSLFARMKIAETERDEWIACHAQLYRKLGNLLAVIHRDGGHYESEHGTEKACADAELAVHVQRGIADGYHDALKIWRQRAEQAEARLAVIDSAPVVATVVDIGDECGPNPNVTFYSCQLPPIGTELIARPARDQT